MEIRYLLLTICLSASQKIELEKVLNVHFLKALFDLNDLVLMIDDKDDKVSEISRSSKFQLRIFKF